MADVCQKKDMRDNIYLNFDQMPYLKSSAWQRLTSDHPNLISNKIVDYPRYLSGEMLNKLSGSSATPSNKRKYTGESVPSPLLRIIHNCEDCDSPCDQILLNLSSDIKFTSILERFRYLIFHCAPHPITEVSY